MLFDRLGICYKYEHPLAVMDRGKVRLWYADFQLPEYGIVIEYAGVNGSREYNKGIERKKKVYAENSIPVLFLYPEVFKGYWPEKVLNKIRELEEKRLENLDEKIERISVKRKEALMPGRGC